MPAASFASVVRARAYFAAQALAGVLWWVAVFASDDVRRWTLGRWDPALVVVPDLVLFAGASAVAAARAGRTAAIVVAGWTTGLTVALATQGLYERTAGWGVVLMAIATVGSVASAATIVQGRLPTRWFFVGPFSFRPAAEASDARHLRRSLAQLVVFWSSFFVAVPIVLAAIERRLRLRWEPLDAHGVRAVAGPAFVVASALGLASCITMARHGKGTPLPAETARELVVAGPYGVVRNPMAVAGVIQTASVGLLVGSWMVVAIAVVGATVWHLLIRPTEEADLAARFGDDYRSYASHVRCWIPSPPRRRR